MLYVLYVCTIVYSVRIVNPRACPHDVERPYFYVHLDTPFVHHVDRKNGCII